MAKDFVAYALGAALILTSSAAAQQYTFADLGTLGGPISRGSDINVAGQVIGSSLTADFVERAYLYTDGVMINLGTLGGHTSYGKGIDESGNIVGSSHVAGGTWRAFSWTEGQMVDLGTLGGEDDDSSASAINDLGQVVGSTDLGEGKGVHAFFYDPLTGMEDLGAIGGVGGSTASDINNVGQVVGISSVDGDNVYHAAVWPGDRGPVDLGTPGFVSSAKAINDAGHAVGKDGWNAIRWEQGADGQWTSIILVDLIDDGFSAARDINNAGQIVGGSGATDGNWHAVLWTNGAIIDLNEFLPSEAGWDILAAANAINEIGQIVGTGRVAGYTRAFLLTPVVQPCEGDLNGDGRVTICHIPPGNPDNAHTISVGARAVPAHLAHGDSCGPCGRVDGLLFMAGESEDCSADVNGDGDVNAADLALLLGTWGQNPGHPADFDDDSVVDAAELAQLLGEWGICP